MKFGFTLPPFGHLADPATMLDLAKTADDAGWDGFFLWDHLMYRPDSPITDPWLLLAAAAVVTERVRLGPMITPLPRRRPWQVAKQAVTLDHLSGGRAVLGVGLGVDHHRDYAAFGEAGRDDRTRAELLDDGLEIITQLWSGEPAHHQGTHLSVDGAQFRPVPLQQPRIPIWCALVWPNQAPLRRAVRYDGVVIVGMPSPDDVRDVVHRIGEQRTDGGPFDVVVIGVDEDPDPYERAGATWALGGPTERMTVDHVRSEIAKGPHR